MHLGDSKAAWNFDSIWFSASSQEISALFHTFPLLPFNLFPYLTIKKSPPSSLILFIPLSIIDNWHGIKKRKSDQKTVSVEIKYGLPCEIVPSKNIKWHTTLLFTTLQKLLFSPLSGALRSIHKPDPKVPHKQQHQRLFWASSSQLSNDATRIIFLLVIVVVAIVVAK